MKIMIPSHATVHGARYRVIILKGLILHTTQKIMLFIHSIFMLTVAYILLVVLLSDMLLFSVQNYM